ncbi:TetR family transcriptional regulator [Clostridium sp. HBUAS56017]|uniref:TetR/AcrR family transcriptional regulator n=1 Tax=Clostridium sp. HBUAS56017 TaxID=2571128 RepID=UPI001177B639|nr:TetR family transcriptional regulator [Clostridium sp. HBUAS56017]
MSKKVDLRVLKTHENIKNAFSNLLLEKSFKDITVQNICDRALIGRSTFYDHYFDKYDLLNKMVHETFDELKPYIKNRFNIINSHDFIDVCSGIIDYLGNRKTTIQALLSVHAETIDLYADLKNLLIEECLNYLEHKKFKSKFNVSNEYICFHYASYVLTSFQLWLQYGESGAGLDLAYEMQEILFSK